MAVMRPQLIMKSIIPVVMAGKYYFTILELGPHRHLVLITLGNPFLKTPFTPSFHIPDTRQ